MQQTEIHQQTTNKNQSKKEHSELITQNEFTVAEELEILRIVERMRKGEEKLYSAEEASQYLGLDN